MSGGNNNKVNIKTRLRDGEQDRTGVGGSKDGMGWGKDGWQIEGLERDALFNYHSAPAQSNELLNYVMKRVL